MQSWLLPALSVCATVFGISFSSEAKASETDWQGAYAGLSIGGQFDANDKQQVEIHPRTYPDMIYLGPVPIITDTYDGGNGPVEFTGTLRVGYLAGNGPIVLGIEARAVGRFANSRETQEWPVSDGSGINAVRADPLPGTYCVAVLGCVTDPAVDILNQTDRVTTRARIKGQLSLVGRVGFAVNAKVLLSAFAGPAFVATEQTIRQETVTQLGVTPFGTIRGFRFSFPIEDERGLRRSSAQVTKSGMKTGGMVGAAIDVRIAPGAGIHFEAGYTRTGRITTIIPDTGTMVRYRPELIDASVGLFIMM